MHSQALTVAAVAFFSVGGIAAPHNENTLQRRSRPDNHTLNRQRADAVKEAFTFAWDGYHKYAFPHDELHPVSNGYSDSRYAY
jgi:mannosyl-oligosaccharide alpha-1,2-mannosidase